MYICKQLKYSKNTTRKHTPEHQLRITNAHHHSCLCEHMTKGYVGSSGVYKAEMDWCRIDPWCYQYTQIFPLPVVLHA